MTKKKETTKKEVKEEVNAESKIGELLGSLLKGLCGDIEKDLKNKRLKLDSQKNYFITYSFIGSEDELLNGQCAICTDLNPFESTGTGMKFLSRRIEMEHNLKDVVILNVIRLEDNPDEKTK